MPHTEGSTPTEGAPLRRGLSIRYSLPLLIAALAAVVIALYATAAYRVMQTTALDSAAERLTAVTGDLSRMLGTSPTTMMAHADSLARDPAVRALLRDPPPDSADALSAVVAQRVIGVELLDAGGGRVLASGEGVPRSPEADPRMGELLRRSRGGAVGEIRVQGDSLMAPVAAAVTAGDTVLGYLVLWRRVAGTGQAQIEQIFGSNARMYVANESGDLWTNISVPVQGPPVRPDTLDGMFGYRSQDGERWLAASAPVPGSPWVVVMEFPRRLALARAQSVLRSFVLLGIVVLLIAAAATWALARRFTAPIMELADTAEDLSAGRYERRSTVSRTDEVGTLSRAINTMAGNVASAHTALEDKVVQLGSMEGRHREVSERLTHVLSASPDVTYQMQVSGDEVEFTWISDNVVRILGGTGDEVRSPGWWQEHTHPDDRDSHAHGPAAFSPDGEAMREYRIRQADGRYRWIRDRQRLIAVGAHRDGGGDAVRTIVGAWSDVTEIRTLEEQFRQAQKLEAVGRLAGGIAHDFNNIVTVILGESDMALSTLPPESPVRDSLDQVRTAGERAALLTRQLLTFSRKQLTETTVFSMNDVVADLQDMLRRVIGEDINLQLRMAKRIAPVAADRGQVEQVLLNLVINARDAMPDGGTIVIETHDVVLDEEYSRSHMGTGTGEFVALVVSDSGTGMTEEVREHLFEPFFTTKAPGKGTGLGLATCYGIARQFGGHIGVYSEVDVGTTMKLYLPRATARESRARPAAPQAEMRRGTETILLVEDEPQVRAIVARMLQAQGYRVMQAMHGHDALELLARTVEPIDLLLTDLVMPQMGGRELAERVQVLRPNLKVLYTSGYTEDVIMQNRLLERDIVLLHKPFTRSALAAKVRETLDTPLTPAGGAAED